MNVSPSFRTAISALMFAFVFSTSAVAQTTKCVYGFSFVDGTVSCNDAPRGAQPFASGSPGDGAIAVPSTVLDNLLGGGPYYRGVDDFAVASGDPDSTAVDTTYYSVALDPLHPYTDPRSWLTFSWRLRWVDFAFVVTAGYLQGDLLAASEPLFAATEARAVFGDLPSSRRLDFGSELANYLRRVLAPPDPLPSDFLDWYPCSLASSSLRLPGAGDATWWNVPSSLSRLLAVNDPTHRSLGLNDARTAAGPAFWPGGLTTGVAASGSAADDIFSSDGTVDPKFKAYLLQLRRLYCNAIHRYQPGHFLPYPPRSPTATTLAQLFEVRASTAVLHHTVSCSAPLVPAVFGSRFYPYPASAASLPGFGHPGESLVVVHHAHCLDHWLNPRRFLGLDADTVTATLCADQLSYRDREFPMRLQPNSPGGEACPSTVYNLAPGDSAGWARGFHAADGSFRFGFALPETIFSVWPKLLRAAFRSPLLESSDFDGLPIGLVQIFACTDDDLASAARWPYRTPRRHIGWHTMFGQSVGSISDVHGRGGYSSGGGLAQDLQVFEPALDLSGDVRFAPMFSRIPICYDAAIGHSGHQQWRSIFTYPCAQRRPSAFVHRSPLFPDKYAQTDVDVTRADWLARQTECDA